MNYVKTRFPEFRDNPIYQYLLLAIITLLAAVLRFYKLGEWSFWYDEMFVVLDMGDGFNYSIVRESTSLALIRATMNLLGTSEWTARLAPALIGFISIPTFYFPIRRMLGRAVGLMAVFLLTVSPWHLFWSQNARFYIALLLFYTLALLTFYLGIEEDRPWYLVISLICLGFAAKERLLALFFVPVVLAYIVLLIILPFEKPPGLRWRNLMIFIVPGAIGGLFFAGPYLRNISDWLINFGWVNNHPLRILGGVVYYVGLSTICIAILGGGYLLIKKNRAALLLGMGAVIPSIAVMGLSTFQYTSARYVFISLTSWIILASLAAMKLLFQPQRSVKVLGAGVSLLLVLNTSGGGFLYFFYENGYRDNIKTAFELISEEKEDGDLVAVGSPLLGKYYLQGKIMGFKDIDLTSIEEIETTVWFVEDSGTYVQFPDVHVWLEQNAQLVTNLDVNAIARDFKIRVYLYYPVSKNLSESSH